MQGKRWKFIIFFALLFLGSPPASCAEEVESSWGYLKTRQKKLLNLQKRNNAMLSKLPESEFSARIKIKSNLVIISTELQNIQDQLESVEEKSAPPSSTDVKTEQNKETSK